MKITKELQSLNQAELNSKKEEFYKELLKMNTQVATGTNSTNPGRIKLVKKNIARINTVLNQKGGTQ